jgi:hypothetical protein
VVTGVGSGGGSKGIAAGSSIAAGSIAGGSSHAISSGSSDAIGSVRSYAVSSTGSRDAVGSGSSDAIDTVGSYAVSTGSSHCIRAGSRDGGIAAGDAIVTAVSVARSGVVVDQAAGVGHGRSGRNGISGSGGHRSGGNRNGGDGSAGGSASGQDEESGAAGIAIGRRLILGGNRLRSQGATVAHAVAVSEESIKKVK